MNAEVWENAPADEHATDNLDSLMPALSTLNSPTHEPCKVRQVFFPSCHEREMLHVSQATDIAELRLGAAAACQGCELLLDVATTHIHERLQEDQIASIRFWGQSWEPGGYQIVLELRDCVDKAEKSSPPKLDDIILEIFQPKGQEQDNAIASSYDLKPACFVKTVSLPSEDTSSDRALHTLQEWIKNCVEKHRVCGRSSPSQLPKRILEIDDTCVYVRENLGSPAKRGILLSAPNWNIYRSTTQDFS
ncbi:hypothetical protein PTMSG1_01702 [Pyrenophora teres f. maculata]|nr:hypothetical protein PTMSG1_01702 [Pyrenophora teres f. maculata]